MTVTYSIKTQLDTYFILEQYFSNCFKYKIKFNRFIVYTIIYISLNVKKNIEYY